MDPIVGAGGMMKSQNAQTKTETKAIRVARVLELTGFSRATLWRMPNTDKTFPKPFHLSPGITAWSEAEVIDWLNSKMAERAA